MKSNNDELTGQSKELLNFIQERLQLYNRKKKASDIAESVVRNVARLNIGNAINDIADANLLPQQSSEDIVLILTQELQKEVVENSIQHESVVPVLEELNEEFIANLKKQYVNANLKKQYVNLQKLLEHFQKQENQAQDIYSFESFSQFITSIKNNSQNQDQGTDIETLKKIIEQYKRTPKNLKEFLQRPCVLTNKVFILRAIARAIIYTIYTEESLSDSENNTLQQDCSQGKLQHEREKECYEHFIQTTILLPHIEKLQRKAEEKYEKEYPNINKLLKKTNVINQYSNYINVAYVFSIVSIFLTRTYTQFMGEDFVAHLEKNHNITGYSNRDWSEYFSDYGGLLNGSPCFHTTALAVIQLFASFPAMLFSAHRTKYINNYIIKDQDTENPKLLNGLTVAMNFRWLANLGMQFIDITSHPLKDLVMRASVFRLFVPTAIIEESGKVVNIKKSLSICSSNGKAKKHSSKAAKFIPWAIAGVLLITEYANTYAWSYLIEKDPQNESLYNSLQFYLNIALKSGRSLALIVPVMSGKKNLYNADYQKFISNGLVRTLSSLALIPLFETTDSLRYVSLLTAVDVLLTAGSDRECGNAIARINNQTTVHYASEKIIMKSYKKEDSGVKTSGVVDVWVQQNNEAHISPYEQDLRELKEYLDLDENPQAFLNDASISQQQVVACETTV